MIAGASLIENPLEFPRMDARLAESIVRKWQNIKSQSLGTDHCLNRLSEVRICNLSIVLIIFTSMIDYKT